MSDDSVFPIMTTKSSDDWSGDAPCRFHPEGGLSKRVLFAAMAMQGILAQRHADLLEPKEAAARAWLASDALLAALEKPK